MTFRYLTRRQAADYLTDYGIPCAAKTLAKYACQGGGPRYIKYGLRVLYRPEDLLAWALAQCSVRSSTSDPGSPLAAPTSSNAGLSPESGPCARSEDQTEEDSE